MTGVILLLVQVILGGITRLTGSGLSITEWDVITGAIPPLTHGQWVEAFDKYRQTPQFRFLNSGFGLSDFKFIFFWEWFHRVWARMVGVVFIVGFVYLLWKKKIKPKMVKPSLIPLHFGGAFRSGRLDHGSQRFCRRRHLCTPAVAGPLHFVFAPRAYRLCLLVLAATNHSRTRASP